MSLIKGAFLLFTIFSSSLFSQKNNQEDKEIRVYAVSWNTSYKLAHTTDNIKQTSLYFFKTTEPWVNIMFDNYEDCVQKLNSRKVLDLPEDASGTKVKTRVLVEILFDQKNVIKVFFDNSGNYYFNNKWHIRNDEFYYAIFKYFSNEIIPETILLETKKNSKGGLWNSSN